MIIVGITGGTGSGKTVLLRILEKQGALALDCDEIYHELLAGDEVMKAEIEARFGGVLKDGEIDRKRLGEMVFSDKSALHELNEITHKFVINEIRHRLAEWEKQGGTVAAIDAIALYESGINEMCDVVVGVIAPAPTRISRIMNRDGITREQAEMRINAQKSDDFYIDSCDEILENAYSGLEEFEEVCDTHFEKLRTK